MRALALLVLLAPLAAASATHMAWDGSTAMALCPFVANVPPAGCVFLEEGERTWTEFAPGATSISGVVTYDAQYPLLNVLHVYVMGLAESGMPIGGYEFAGVETIPFSVDLSSLPAHHHALSIHGDSREVRVGPSLVLAEFSQPFRVELDLAQG